MGAQSASGICSHVAIRSRATCQPDTHQTLFSDTITRRFGVRTQTLYPTSFPPVLASKLASGRRPPRSSSSDIVAGSPGRVQIIVMAEQEPLAMPLEEAMRLNGPSVGSRVTRLTTRSCCTSSSWP